jgi:TRAP-type uncharacterized transport system substrate-binding protein
MWKQLLLVRGFGVRSPAPLGRARAGTTKVAEVGGEVGFRPIAFVSDRTQTQTWGRLTMRRITVAMLAVALTLGVWSGGVLTFTWAQEIPRSLQQGGPDAEMRVKKNAWTVGIAGGIVEGTFFRFAEDMRKLLDDGDEMRVLPIVTRGSASNIDDLLYVRGVDLAVTQSDVFEFFRTQRKIANLDGRIHYILRFPISEVAIIARNDIRTVADLRGKKVDFGDPGTSGSLTAPILFRYLGIEVKETPLPAPYTVGAYMKVAAGEVDAAVRVVGKPVPHIAQIPPNSGLHLVPIPFTGNLADYYTIGEYTNADYPNLVPPGQTVDTLAVPTVLAVYNWPKGSERYRKVERFVTRLFENWDKLRNPPYHPKWRDINLAATVPGWTRWSVAEEMLQRIRQASGVNATQAGAAAEFAAFLQEKGVGTVQPSPDQREALFREFLQWQEQRQRVSRQR